jgi:O-antigen/teichoic acid export membrane protein
MRGLKYLFGSNVWINSIYFLKFILIGLILSPVEFGSFRLALVYISIAVSVAMVGLNTAMTHQFPLFSNREKFSAWNIVRKIVVFNSFLAGIVVYIIFPKISLPKNVFQDLFYLISFVVAIAGTSLCNVLLSISQAAGDFKGYSKLQISWKTLLSIFALIGCFWGESQAVLISMSLSYALIYIFNSKASYFQWLDKSVDVDFRKVVKSLVKSGVWPFAAICMSIIYSNIEFLYINVNHLNSGEAGAYALASLIFVGGSAFFTPFQTYAGSLVVNRKISLKEIIKIQIICFISVLIVAVAALFFSFLLTKIYPLKFNDVFFGFAILVSVKLALWGSFSVIGSILNYLDKGFESFILTAFCLMGVLIGSFFANKSDIIKDMLILQIASYFILFLGSMYLVVGGYKARSIS